MKIKSVILAAIALVCVNVSSARSEDLISLGAGYYDINDDEGAADFRAEYRWDNPLLWHLKPWVGVEATSDGAVYGAGGVLLDLVLADHWTVTPSFGAGLYGDGDGKDLGHVVEFRSQIELGYKFVDESRFGVAFGHISNAGLDNTNPGTEILNVYYHFPANWLFN